MSGNICVTSKVVPLTRELVVEYNALDGCDGERDLSDERVHRIENLIKSGEFAFLTISVAILRDRDNKRVRVNAHHRLFTLAQFMDSDQFRAGVPVTIDEVTMDSADIGKVFDWYDSPW